MPSSFIIAATSSGCGKTTLALGLMRSLSEAGLHVSPFKCGPDYIDTQFHTLATGNESVNLDLFLSSEEHIREIYNRYGCQGDINIIEGVMGMFDGFIKMNGSSADISRILNIPIVLLVNAASTAYSVAATIHGFKNYNKGIRIAGVIFNRVASESHFSLLKDACADAGVECFGYMKRDDSISIPSRHLGLSLSSKEEMKRYIDRAADIVAANVDIQRLLEATRTERKHTHGQTHTLPHHAATVAIARDEAFNFIYRENVRSLSERFNVSYFSPLHDLSLPEADLVYLPGGYPELFATELNNNKSMKAALKAYAENGGRLWAECGGMIYLTEAIDGEKMCGILPMHCSMSNARLTIGYRRIKFDNCEFFGHEFHYSHLTDPERMPNVARQFNARGSETDTPVYRHKNVFASYTHMYWGDNDLIKLWEE